MRFDLHQWKKSGKARCHIVRGERVTFLHIMVGRWSLAIGV